jgi:hypothetical protein
MYMIFYEKRDIYEENRGLPYIISMAAPLLLQLPSGRLDSILAVRTIKNTNVIELSHHQCNLGSRFTWISAP